jgi:hypothetical protein
MALPGLFCTVPLRAAPLEILQKCAGDVSAGVSGLKNLKLACPELEDALQALGLDRTLYEGWREKLNRDSLADVAQLAGRYRGSVPSSAPKVSSLDGILKAIAREQAPAPKSWWDALKVWLNSWLSSHDTDSLSWLDRLLERLRQSVTLLNTIQYVLLGLVVLAASWVIINELKAAGLTAGKRKAAASDGRDRKLPTGAAASPASDSTAMTERLSELLQLLVMRLTQSGRLKAERSLTHRELVVRSSFDSDSQRAVFADVAASAESMLYGGRGVAGEHMSRVLRAGQSLLAQLPGSSNARSSSAH